MATVSILQPDHTLEERIYDLKKRSLSAAAARILEEAMQLLGNGRHIEAAALVDKAEAMSPPVLAGAAVQAGAAGGSGENVRANLAQPFAARLVTDISDGLTRVLLGAIQELEAHLAGETRSLTSALSERLDKIQATVEHSQAMAQRLDGLAEAGVAVEAKYAQLATVTASLQEAGSRHDAEIGALRLQVQDVSALARDRVDEICRRMEEQERQLSSANSTTSELATRIAAAAERLERHAGAIRALHLGHQQRAAALDQVAEVLGRMRAPTETPEAIAAL